MGDTLAGHVALITGGAGGLGSSSAAALAGEGAHIVVADIDQERVDDAVARLRSQDLSAEGLMLDVTDSAAVGTAVQQIVVTHGRLDILLTSQGFPKDRKLIEMTDDEWDEVIRVCLTGTFICIREAARAMIDRSYGRIITISSRAWWGNPGQANYSAAKAGVVGLTRSVAKELGRHGITANAIAPGLVDTPSLQAMATYESIRDRAIASNSVKRLGEPQDVASAVLYLASPQSSFLTGEVLHVSGGRFS